MKNDIFISIAAYKDPELVPTLRDCMEKAKFPENLHFVVCWQYDKSDEFNKEFLDGVKNKEFGKITVIKIPYKKSDGVCFARSKIQDEYKDEAYILQLDSHHRFIKNWDTLLISEIKKLKKQGHKKPILTAYLPSYEPDNDPDGRINIPWEQKFDRFLPQGPAMPQPESIDDYKSLKKPVGARLYSAHFIFSIGDYYKEVLYDPHLYFHGEEVSLIIRAYTHGYDIFHPHKLVAWHYYTREGSKKHWDDAPDWSASNDISHARYRQLVGIKDTGIDLGKYGLGSERTLEEYIKYSGIDVSNKKVHKKTLNRERPPLKYKSEEEYKNGFCKKIRYCIDLHKSQATEEDCDVWVIAFKDKEGNDVYRQDCDINEIKQIKQSCPEHQQFYNIWREYEDNEEPHSWIVWQHSTAKGWLDIISGDMPT
jgi:hypothetical protein